MTDRRGKQNYDWAHHHRQFVDMWAYHCASVISALSIDCPIYQGDPHMIWYQRITHLLIGNPATHPNTGYHGVGDAMEAMVKHVDLASFLFFMIECLADFLNISRPRAYKKYTTVPLMPFTKTVRS